MRKQCFESAHPKMRKQGFENAHEGGASKNNVLDEMKEF